MNEYETIFVLKPDSPEAQVSELLGKFGSLIERHNGTVFQQKNWGRRDLAYRVEKYHHGLYYYYDYCGDHTLVADLERSLRLHDLPLKFLTVKLKENVDIELRKKEIAEALASPSVLEPTSHPREEDGEEDVRGGRYAQAQR